VSQYPTVAGLRVLREAVAGYVGRRFGVDVDPDTQVLPTTGSKEAIFSTPLAFVDRAAGDAVIWPTPGYPIYERGALLAGAEGSPVVLGGDFLFRPEMVTDDQWRQAVLAWICTPHNPTGSVMDRDLLAAFYARARATDTLLCSDECYADLYEHEPPPSVLEVAGGDQRGVLAYLSLSKRSGMTGYRSGAIVGDAEAIAALRSMRTATGTAPPEFAQMAAVAAWSDDQHAAERRAIFAQKRKIVRAGFEELGYETIGSEAGLYLWVAVADDLAIAEKLLEAGVVVSPGRAFGPGGDRYIRLALVPTVDECAHAVEVVQRCLRES
jgi:succinyldiaminopimelate transaminase